MLSDLAIYGLLVSVFIVTGLRMFIEKPNKLSEITLPRFRREIGKNPRRDLFHS